jgi:cytochrome c
MHVTQLATIWIRRCALALTVMVAAGCDSEAAPDAGRVDTGDLERGRRLIDQFQCGACHTIPGVPLARGIDGPPLDQFGRRSYIAGKIPNTEALLAKWIADPHSMISTTTMPSMGASEEEARHMAAYLRSLQ